LHGKEARTRSSSIHAAADELTEIRSRKDHPTFFVPGRTAGIAASDSGTASGS
jgi:hypothetical protein